MYLVVVSHELHEDGFVQVLFARFPAMQVSAAANLGGEGRPPGSLGDRTEGGTARLARLRWPDGKPRVREAGLRILSQQLI